MLNTREPLREKIGVAFGRTDHQRIDQLAAAAGVGRAAIVRAAALRALPDLERARDARREGNSGS